LSDIRANTISDAAGTGPIAMTGQNGAKFWARMGTSAAITYSGLNLSSATDTAVGQTALVFTNNFSGDTTFAPHVTILTGSEASWVAQIIPITSTGFTVNVVDEASNFADRGFIVSAVGELA